MGVQNCTKRAEQAAFPVDECAVAIECYGFEAIEVQGPEILSGKNPGYTSFRQLGDAFEDGTRLPHRSARKQLYATTDLMLARRPEVFISLLPARSSHALPGRARIRVRPAAPPAAF